MIACATLASEPLVYSTAPGSGFGPVNSAVGHRRLNVLFTRAKRATLLFTSLRPTDITITEKSHAGVRALQSYLTYASAGPETDSPEGGAPDSDFEVFVAERLRNAGYEVVPQVGVNSFRIDLGVRDPDRRNLFLAGIECDGASYHSGITGPRPDTPGCLGRSRLADLPCVVDRLVQRPGKGDDEACCLAERSAPQARGNGYRIAERGLRRAASRRCGVRDRALASFVCNHDAAGRQLQRSGV